MRWMRTCAWQSVWAFVLASPPSAQDVPALLWHEVPAANATALAVLWQHGFDDDDPANCGAARVLAECRLERARATVPAIKTSGMQVGGDAAVVFAVATAGAWADAMAFVAALLDDSLPMADDQLALVIARTALAADDGEHLYAGLVLQSRARATLCRGTRLARPVAGSAPAIAALSPARVRELLRTPVAVRVAGLGALPPALREAVARLPLPATASPVPAAVRRAVAAAPAGQAIVFEPHPRCDAPFLAAAFLAPPRELLPAFAVGIEVARARAQQQWKARRFEVLARAPFVNWSWLHGDPVVVFCRRGVDGVKLLPGERAKADAAGEATATAAEIEGLLANLRRVPPAAAELAEAKRVLHLELSLLPTTPAGQAAFLGDGALLPGRLQVLMLGRFRGIDATAVAAVTEAAVAAVLGEVLAPERACWCGLMPLPRSNVGWLPR